MEVKKVQLQWSQILLVGTGGFVGSVLRFWLGNWFIPSIPPTWPWGTFLANLIGCLLIGIFLGIANKSQNGDIYRILLASGFCGGFTTFSAFSNEGLQMLRYQLYLLFAAYAISSIILGLLGVAAGYFIIRIIN